MPDADSATSVPPLRPPTTDATERESSGVAAEAKPVEFVLVRSDIAAPATVPRPRSRGTLPVVGMFVLAVIVALYFGRAVLMPILFGMIMAVVFAPIVEKLSRLRIAEPIGAAIVMLAMAGIVALAFNVLILPAWDVLAELPVQVQNILASLLAWVRSFRFGSWLAPRDTSDLTKQAAAQGITMTAELLKLVQSFIFSAVSASLLAYFLLSSGDLFLSKLVRVLPIFRDKVRAVTVVRTVQREVATYFASVTMINIGLGIAVTLLTWAFGLPMPWFWGALVGLLNFVPYVGAGISALLLLLAGMAFTESSGQALILMVCFMGITFFEGQLLNPFLVGKRLELNPTVVFVALLFWGWLWGIGGMLLAVPLLIIIKKFADQSPGWEAVSEFLAR